jgi:23S rRNA-/tRNA-specific pseudouridylate synthase
MAFALSSEDARLLQESLTSSDARKEYLALVRGSTAERWECDRPLKSESGDPKPAYSIFEKIAEYSGLTLLRARILTGRRHQIRRHLAHAAHQVLGDSTYGKGRINRYFRETYGLPRMFLHASMLTFRHPRTREPIVARAPLPADLRGFLMRLPDVPPGLIESL